MIQKKADDPIWNDDLFQKLLFDCKTKWQSHPFHNEVNWVCYLCVMLLSAKVVKYHPSSREKPGIIQNLPKLNQWIMKIHKEHVIHYEHLVTVHFFYV